jgi:glycosyltransferase involved in cell wall biosynthesis
MRIVVIHNLKRGGAWRRLQEQTRRLDGDVLELTLATATPVTENPYVIPYAERAPVTRRELRPPRRYTDALRLGLAWRHVAQMANRLRPDVIFANPCQFLQAPPILLSHAIPALYFCDEPRRIDYEPAIRHTRNSQTRLLYAPLYAYERRLDAASVRRAPALATNSSYSSARLLDVYGVESSVVPMGVADVFLRGTLECPRTDNALSVGMLTALKGHDLVIRAAARSARIRQVTIVSPRPDDEEEQRLRRLAHDVGIDLTIRVGITDEELRSEYGRARVTAYLARGEPFGLAALEAQACGCPVVAAGDAGLREAIIDGMTGYAVDRSPDAAASAFDLLCDPQIGANTQREAAKHGRAATWDISTATLRDLLTRQAAS